MTTEPAHGAVAHALGDLGNVVLRRRRRLVEAHARSLRLLEHAVCRDRVKMNVQIQAPTEHMGAPNRARLRAVDAREAPGQARDLLREDAVHGADHPGLHRRQASQLPRQRQDPLSWRLLDVLRELRAAGVLGRSGWGVAVAPCAAALTLALDTAPARAARRVRVDARHEEAARASPHPAHTLGARLHRALREGLDDPDPRRIARVVAEGALAPLADHTRFEIAVLLRLVQALAARRPGFALRHAIVASGRRAVAELEGDGARVGVHYDQAFLDPGPYDAGLRRYFGQRGRLRPDITVTVETREGAARAALVEAKLSVDPDYLAQGFRDAIVYASEYGGALRGWPKVILVTAAPRASAPHRGDDVIAVGWDQWVPDEVVDGLLAGT